MSSPRNISVASPYLVPFDGKFSLRKAVTTPPGGKRSQKAGDKRTLKKALKKAVKKIAERQRVLYADDRYSVLTVFQAMDAAGKDGTIRSVFSGVNPAGCEVYSFKQPSAEELDHDFLWRVHQCIPQRGRIGIFNRSHYEEALVVRVHPEYLQAQRLPKSEMRGFWMRRLRAIADFEKYLAENGVVIMKFWLNVSRQEQKKRFLDRIDEQKSNWKFSAGDIEESHHWAAYMQAYKSALEETSRAWAPWYAVPADNKPYMRKTVAEIIAQTLSKLDLDYPSVSTKQLQEMKKIRRQLM